MTALYCDESGYTGTDLVSEAQPFLIISSLLLNDGEVTELSAPLQAATQAQELKYSNLVKWAKSRTTLLGFARQLDEMQEKIRFHLTNKRFALLGKIVDLLVEPVFHAQGIDFYADGQNLAYLNTLYVATLQVDADRDSVLRAFLDLCRQPTDERFGRLSDAVRVLAARSDELLVLCEPILAGVDLRRRFAPSSLDKDDLR